MNHFSLEEVRCRETSTLPSAAVLDSNAFALFVSVLNEIRGDTPLRVSSWYRSPLHSVEKRKPHPGVHTTGLAVDLLVRGDRALHAVRVISREGYAKWLGLGVSQKGEERFIHLDFGGHPLAKSLLPVPPPRPTMWSY